MLTRKNVALLCGVAFIAVIASIAIGSNGPPSKTYFVTINNTISSSDSLNAPYIYDFNPVFVYPGSLQDGNVLVTFRVHDDDFINQNELPVYAWITVSDTTGTQLLGWMSCEKYTFPGSYGETFMRCSFDPDLVGEGERVIHVRVSEVDDPEFYDPLLVSDSDHALTFDYIMNDAPQYAPAIITPEEIPVNIAINTAFDCYPAFYDHDVNFGFMEPVHAWYEIVDATTGQVKVDWSPIAIDMDMNTLFLHVDPFQAGAGDVLLVVKLSNVDDPLDVDTVRTSIYQYPLTFAINPPSIGLNIASGDVFTGDFTVDATITDPDVVGGISDPVYAWIAMQNAMTGEWVTPWTSMTPSFSYPVSTSELGNDVYKIIVKAANVDNMSETSPWLTSMKFVTVVFDDPSLPAQHAPVAWTNMYSNGSIAFNVIDISFLQMAFYYSDADYPVPGYFDPIYVWASIENDAGYTTGWVELNLRTMYDPWYFFGTIDVAPVGEGNIIIRSRISNVHDPTTFYKGYTSDCEYHVILDYLPNDAPIYPANVIYIENQNGTTYDAPFPVFYAVYDWDRNFGFVEPIYTWTMLNDAATGDIVSGWMPRERDEMDGVWFMFDPEPVGDGTYWFEIKASNVNDPNDTDPTKTSITWLLVTFAGTSSIPAVTATFVNEYNLPLLDSSNGLYFTWSASDPDGIHGTDVQLWAYNEYWGGWWGMPIPTTLHQTSGVVDFKTLTGNVVGQFYIEVTATDEDGITCDPVFSETITIADDDLLADITNINVNIVPYGILVTCIDVDQSGIIYVGLNDIDDMYTRYTTEQSGKIWTISIPFYYWPGTPGQHVLRLIAIDYDLDGEYDQATTIYDVPFMFAPIVPEITIETIGWQPFVDQPNNGQGFQWTATDETGIYSTLVTMAYSEDGENWEFAFVPTGEYHPTGFTEVFRPITMNKYLGYYYIVVSATNTQGYSCDPVMSEIVKVVDDDTSADISGIVVYTGPYGIWITCTDVDQSSLVYVGLNDIDGAYTRYMTTQHGTTWVVEIPFYYWPGTPGMHVIHLIAIDYDLDREGDQAWTIHEIPFMFAPIVPEILIDFVNPGNQPMTDDPSITGQGFQWSAWDETGIYHADIQLWVYSEYWGGWMGVPVPTYEYQQSGFVDIVTLIGARYVGQYYLEVIATNTMGYACDPVISEIIQINDDDTSVDIANIAITVTPGTITVTFTGIDQSGIEMTTPPDVDGMPVLDYTVSVVGTSWTISFENEWTNSPGTHVVSVLVSDLDNDWIGDQSSAFVTVLFTITSGDPFMEQMDILEQALSMATSWRNPVLAAEINAKIAEVISLHESGDIAGAHDKLLHDVKPKLTGLKIDENGDEWGNGVFKNAWITSLLERSTFSTLVDSILSLLH